MAGLSTRSPGYQQSRMPPAPWRPPWGPRFSTSSSIGLARGKALAELAAVGNVITPRWFATYGTPIRAGRDIDNRDTRNAPGVMVVNETFIRTFLPGRSGIGETVPIAVGVRGEVPLGSKSIVGVVADAVYISQRDGLRPTIYLPLAQWDLKFPLFPTVNISVQSAGGSPVPLARVTGAALTAVDEHLSFTFRLLSDQVEALLTQERLVRKLAGLFGVVALFLAALGLFGVTSYAVTRRRTEIAIRMALGAEPARVVRAVLCRVFLLVGGGVLVGAAASLWLSQFVAALLFGVESRDPSPVSIAALVLMTVGLLAGLLPASGAARIQPADVLKAN